MAHPPDTAARHPPPDRGHAVLAGHGCPIAASCVPMLAGAVALVLDHRASTVFLVLFTGCTALLVLLLGGASYAHWVHARPERVPARQFPRG